MITPEQLLAGGRDRLETLLTQQRDWARDCLADGTRTSWMPHLAALTVEDDGAGGPRESITLFALDVNFNEGHEKRPLLRRLGGELFGQRKVPLAAVLTAEAWLQVRHPGAAPGVPYCEPRHDPARVEIISCAGRTLDGKHQCMCRLDLTRGPGNGIVPGEWSEVRWEGAKANLLGCFFEGFWDAAKERFGDR